MKKIILLALVLPLACNIRRRNCPVYAADILRRYPKKVYVVRQDGNRIIGISDYGRDKTKSGAYYFFPDGKLQYYRFFETDSAYDYEEEYNEEGQIIKTLDNPLVDTRIREVNMDSANIGYCLFSLNKDYSNVKLTLSNGLEFHPDLKDDTTFSNMKWFSISLNTKNLSRFKIFFSCNYENTCTSQKFLIRDTLPLVKNPKLNLDE